jgi:asparagine synthase (glutamine-hydrolysing)
MEQAVLEQMVSDVPLGAFLSGGIDSSAVVAFMARHSDRPVKTYSIGFGGEGGGAYYNELPYARRVAQLFRTDHHEIEVAPDAAALLPRLLWHLDEPVADSAFVTTYLVSEFARREVTVILVRRRRREPLRQAIVDLGPSYDRFITRACRAMAASRRARAHRATPAERSPSPLMNLSALRAQLHPRRRLDFEDRYRSTA